MKRRSSKSTITKRYFFPLASRCFKSEEDKLFPALRDEIALAPGAGRHQVALPHPVLVDAAGQHHRAGGCGHEVAGRVIADVEHGV